MIHSFGNSLTENIFNGIKSRETIRFPQNLLSVTRRKLDMVEFAVSIHDLKIPPANRLEKLKGKLSEFYSIRVNDQWRIIFRWEGQRAYDVQIIDYH
jgi:proteic killer suppression protein